MTDVTMTPNASEDEAEKPRRRRRATAPRTTVGTDEATPQAEAGTKVPEAAEEKPKRTRAPRKRTTAETAPPEAEKQADAADGDDNSPAINAESPDIPATSPAVSPEATPVRRSRRATAKQGAPAPADPAAVVAAEAQPEVIEETADEPVVDEAEADVTAEVEADVTAEVEADVTAEAEADAPADADGQAPDEDAEPETDLAAAEPTELVRPADRAAGLDVVAELGAAFGGERPIPRLATTAVLFQAPEPCTRSRRAEAPAGPPKPAEEIPEPAVEPDGAPEADHGDDDQSDEQATRKRRRRGGRGRRGKGGEDTDQAAAAEPAASADSPAETADDAEESGSRRRRRRRRRSEGDDIRDEVSVVAGSTRLEAKRQRRREGRESGRRRTVITEAEFLARREAVDRRMVVRDYDGRTQIAVLEDGVLVEHYVARKQQASLIGSVYLGKVQNVLPSMEAAFVDIGKGRNAVLYAGEVNWDAAGLEGQPRRIEQALASGDAVLVQVTKDPVGHKGARLTSQITLAGRYLVYVPGGGMTGISRKLPENERGRLKKLLREIVPDGGGVIVRTAAEGASEADLRADVERLTAQWAEIEKKSKTATAPAVLREEPDLAIRVVRDIFNDDFKEMIVAGDEAWKTISKYVTEMAPDLVERLHRWTEDGDLFAAHKVDAQLAKGLDRKVWLPSGGSLVIDRTEAMTVIDVNTGKYTGSGGTLEETITRNNLEAAEEIVRQLRLRDIGGIIVIDFIDMVLEANRDLVLRRLVECLARDRTKHQVAEVSSLGLVQMTRKRVGQGLLEVFTTPCDHCGGRGYHIHDTVIDSGRPATNGQAAPAKEEAPRRSRKQNSKAAPPTPPVPVLPAERSAVRATLATIAAAAASAHASKEADGAEEASEATVEVAAPVEDAGPAEDVSDAPVEVDASVEDAAADEAGAPAELEATDDGAEDTPADVAADPDAARPTFDQDTPTP